jgi:hypothetical protein
MDQALPSQRCTMACESPCPTAQASSGPRATTPSRRLLELDALLGLSTRRQLQAGSTDSASQAVRPARRVKLRMSISVQMSGCPGGLALGVAPHPDQEQTPLDDEVRQPGRRPR